MATVKGEAVLSGGREGGGSTEPEGGREKVAGHGRRACAGSGLARSAAVLRGSG
jgi:hypothetical protein